MCSFACAINDGENVSRARRQRKGSFGAVKKNPLTSSGAPLTISATDIAVTDTMTAQPLKQLLPLTPAVFHILLALADEDRHGYSIMQHVAKTTEGAVRMGAGTLYGTI